MMKWIERNIDKEWMPALIVGANYSTGVQHVTTFGKSLEACENASKGGNAIKKLLGWPPDKCKDIPSRLKNKKK